jgi:hypothetical protein
MLNLRGRHSRQRGQSPAEQREDVRSGAFVQSSEQEKLIRLPRGAHAVRNEAARAACCSSAATCTPALFDPTYLSLSAVPGLIACHRQESDVGFPGCWYAFDSEFDVADGVHAKSHTVNNYNRRDGRVRHQHGTHLGQPGL